MIKTTIWRQVVIAALLAGGSFTVAANPPPPPPVSYGVEEDVFHPVRARQGDGGLGGRAGDPRRRGYPAPGR